MPDEISTGELARQIQRMENRRYVGEELYVQAQRETDRRFAELERDLADEKKAREEAVKELRELQQQRNAQRGTDWRQALYSGLIPAALVLVGILYQALRGG